MSSSVQSSRMTLLKPKDLIKRARENYRLARRLDRLDFGLVADDLRRFAKSQLKQAREWLPKERRGE